MMVHRKRRGLLACVAALALAVASRAPSAQGPRPGDGLIVGQVVDAGSGRPVSGATVRLIGGSGRAGTRAVQEPRILTGSDGRFVFRGLARGSFGIVADKPGHVPGAYGRNRPAGPSRTLTLADGERVGGIVVRMWKHGAITGTVFDEAGEPLVNILVHAFWRTIANGRTHFQDGGSAATDDRGIYRISGLLPASYIVGVNAVAVSVPRSLAQLNDFPPTAAALTGTPAEANSPTRARRVGDDMLVISERAPTPPPPGPARAFMYPPAFYPSGGGIGEAALITVPAGGELSAIDLHLRPVASVSVSGTVVGPDGPPAGMRLLLAPADRGQAAVEHELPVAIHELPVAITDRDGSFTFLEVPEGRYAIVGTMQARAATADGPGAPLLWADTPLSVAGDDVRDLPIVLQNGLRFRGHIAFDGSMPHPTGRGLEGIPIVVERVDGDPFLVNRATGRVDGNGRFTTDPFPPGEYLLKVTGSPVGWMFASASYGGRDISISPVDLTGDIDGVVLTFTDRWTGVQGSVTSNGRPDPDALVVLFPVEPQAWAGYGSNPRRVKSARTAKTGGYVINSVPPGDYYLVALPDEDAADWQDPAVLQELTRIASRIGVGDGEKVSRSLRTRELRR